MTSVKVETRTSLSDDEYDVMDKNYEKILELIRSLVRSAFSEMDKHHGIDHALQVEEYVNTTSRKRQISNIHRFLVRVAALLHDVGYAAFEPGWSNDRREHVFHSIEFAVQKLPGVSSIFHLHKNLMTVIFLIAYHDNTNYMYPSTAWGGYVKPVELGKYDNEVRSYFQSISKMDQKCLQFLLDLLREADALTATSEQGAERTFEYSVNRGLPIFAEGNPLNAYCWEESAIGNVRIAAKRALTDAKTVNGRKLALSQYNEMESYVENYCKKAGKTYQRELLLQLVNGDIMGENFNLLFYAPFDQLETQLRQVPLHGDKSIHPYSNAVVMPSRMRIADLRPTAYYILRPKVASYQILYRDLEAKYKLSLFDLTGVMEYELENRTFRMAPPIVETYKESTENAEVSAIVDGLHRIWLAKELGFEEIWVINIKDVSPKHPLVPLPLRWHEVRLEENVPPQDLKRKFRFPELTCFPDISDISTKQITEENFRYFFYRDLSSLGSGGIRESPK